MDPRPEGKVTDVANKFFLEIYTGAPLHERATFERFWSLLSDPLVGAAKWGRYERTTEAFTDDSSEAHRIFGLGKMIFIKGTRDGFLCKIERWRGNLVIINIWWNEAAFGREASRARWLEWIFRLLEAHPALFGYGTPQREYDAKHRVETSESTSAVGVSHAELHEFLPGIYWMTVFGFELRHALDVERLRDMPGVKVQYLVPDQAVVLLDEPASAADLDARLAKLRAIAERLGAVRFFDRAQPQRELQPIAQFVDALVRLERAS